MDTVQLGYLCHQLLKVEKLNDTEDLVLHLSLQGKTYQQIANSSGYDEDYIRDVGFRLWRKLSKHIGIKVTKKNVHSVLQRYASESAQESSLALSAIDWGEILETNVLYGRDRELNNLKQWILKDRCNLVGIFGMGGIGKTSLAARFAKEVQTEFDFVVWHSLLNSPAIEPTLSAIIKFISKQQSTELTLAQDLNGIIQQLLYYLHESRCLLIFDNLETILRIKTINYDGQISSYRKEDRGYSQLIETIANYHHQSCLLLTGREIPSKFVSLSRNSPMVYSLRLSGLNISECQQIIRLQGIIKSNDYSTEKLINYYAGNPLVLKIIATSIVDLFNGNLEEFWQSEVRVFGEINDLLDQQWQRLSDLEKNVMYWLAIARKPISLNHLEDYSLSINSPSQLLTVLQSLKRRSLIERTIKGFTLLPFIMDYITEKFTCATGKINNKNNNICCYI
ncbi:MAG: ATP-binding protein [Pleurocapsa sp. MO_226.B13]|nr:ATP-binding protein [Pleurocapsa sp. MO_226.B13]